jgi:aspartyl-tRNA(Asn)/glutamyl-tRNA(Gln) amidotransferase subunit B
MEEGSLRCDANVSVRRRGDPTFGTKTELKNMNSFRNVERAVEYEIGRQIAVLEAGGTVVQETLLWDPDQNIASPMRSKEEAHDYRYFPDPDLVPVLVDDAWIATIRAGLPELPAVRRDRFVTDLGLPRYDADVLTADRQTSEYFEATLAHLGVSMPGHTAEKSKAVSNWVMTEVLRVVAERKVPIQKFPIEPVRLADMITLIREGIISGKIAKDVFEEMLASPATPRAIVEQKGWLKVSDTGVIEQEVDHVLDSNRSQVEKYLAGNERLFGYFVGETMKRTRGKANPQVVNEILQRKLRERKG